MGLGRGGWGRALYPPGVRCQPAAGQAGGIQGLVINRLGGVAEKNASTARVIKILRQ